VKTENNYDDGAVSKLAGIETGADVTDETNVKAAIDGMTLSDVGTPASTDRILLQDADDSNNLKYADFSEFGGGGGSGDVTSSANVAENAIVTGDGGAKGVQDSSVTIADTTGALTFNGTSPSINSAAGVVSLDTSTAQINATSGGDAIIGNLGVYITSDAY